MLEGAATGRGEGDEGGCHLVLFDLSLLICTAEVDVGRPTGWTEIGLCVVGTVMTAVTPPSIKATTTHRRGCSHLGR